MGSDDGLGQRFGVVLLPAGIVSGGFGVALLALAFLKAEDCEEEEAAGLPQLHVTPTGGSLTWRW